MSESRTAFFQQMSPGNSPSGQTLTLTRLAPWLFVVLSLVLHALLFFFLDDSRAPIALDPPLQDRRLEISFIVEALPEPVTESATEEVLQEAEIPQREISSVAEKPRRDGEPSPVSTPFVAEETPAEVMPEPASAATTPPAEQVADLSSLQPLVEKTEGQPRQASAKTQSVTLVETQVVEAEVASATAETPPQTSDSIAQSVANEARTDGARELPPELAFLEQLAPAPGQNSMEPWQEYGNMKPLNDTELANIRSFIDGDDPSAQRWRAISQHLVRLEQQIYRTWNGQGKWPLELGGVIRFQLTEEGALQKVYVQMGSGRADFDQSLLDAIQRAISRGTDDTRHLAGLNYRYFRFEYNAAGRARQPGELLPWEREKIVAGELGQNADS